MKLRVVIVLVVLVAIAPTFFSATCQAVVQSALAALTHLIGAGNA
ncbi:MAG TPA: hypothetical protein VJQ79_14070 [Acidimicrobiia bacterium]|jgi:hypothetical protein|nr:hypothetical protein [Acidimicrobiia bacterium]